MLQLLFQNTIDFLKKNALFFFLLILLIHPSFAHADCTAEQLKCNSGGDKVLTDGTDFNTLKQKYPSTTYVCVEFPTTQTVPTLRAYDSSCKEAGSATQSDSTGKPKVSTCSLTGEWSFDECIFKPTVTSIGGLILAASGGILRASGWLFDWFMSVFIVQFGTTVKNTFSIMNGIEIGWTFFRDLANLAIISAFAFVAISIVLGLQEYGDKKFIARLIIIAILINFSLVFTKIIVDISNLTATKFYNTIQKTNTFSTVPRYCKSSAQSGGSVNKTLQAPTFDIATAFLRPLCIESVWDDSKKVLENVGRGQNATSMTVLMYGIMAMIFLGLLAVMFVYGSILMLTRGIMIIVLMISAAIAFAAYGIPKAQGIWDTWWRELINNALFAPFLLVGLTLTLVIITTAGGTMGSNQSQSLADAFSVASGSSGGSWQLLALYALAIGLLIATFKLSSSLADMVGGSRMITGGLKLGAKGGAMGLLLGGAAATSFGMQRVLGKYNMNKRDDTAEKLFRARTELKNIPQGTVGYKRQQDAVVKLNDRMKKYENRAKSDYNLFDTKLGKGIANAAGMKGAGETPKEKQGGWLAKEQNATKEAYEQAKLFKTSAADERRMVAEQEQARAQLVSDHTEKMSNIDAIRSEYEQNIGNADGARLRKEISDSKNDEKSINIKISENTGILEKAQKDLENARSANVESEIQAAESRLRSARSDRTQLDAQLNTATQRIANARATLNVHNTSMDTAMQSNPSFKSKMDVALNDLKNSQQTLDTFDAENKNLKEQVKEQNKEVFVAAQERYTEDATKTLSRLFGADERMRQRMKKGMSSEHNKREEAEKRKKRRESLGLKDTDTP